MKLKYYIVDAFTEQRFEGAQIAVFPQAEALSTEQMQLIAREMNLSETVFIGPAVNASVQAALRIFSPQKEVQQAGQAIIAAVFAMQLSTAPAGEFQLELADHQLSVEVFEQDARPVINYLCGEEIRLDAYVPAARELADILGLEEKDIEQARMAMLASCIDDYLIVPVKTQQQLSSACFKQNKWTMSFVASLASKIFVFCEDKTAAPVDFFGRLLGMGIGPDDDPPVGSVAPAFAAYLMHQQAQGEMNVLLQRGGGERRKSLIHIQVKKQIEQPIYIKVGGSAVLLAEGEMYL